MSVNFKPALLKSALAASVLLLAGEAAVAQVNLTAGPAVTTLPDGTVVHMWGYTCGTATGATCTALNKAVAAGTAPAGTWSPVVITVPTGQDLQINLTNNLSFANSNTVPTSLTIVGQLGGGLGTRTASCDPTSTATTGATCTASPDHTNAQPVTWPIAGTPPGAAPAGVGTPPVQGPRVQSFATEVPAGSTTLLCWGACGVGGPALKPGTYLIESGTHPSIQGPMGLYGMLVVTTAPSGTTLGTAYGTGTTAVTYNAEIPLLLSEIDPAQNNAVNAAVNTAGFSETAVWSGQLNPTVIVNPVTGVPIPLPVTSATTAGCGDRLLSNGSPNPAYQTCYPPAVNYTPLYYLINGTAFDKTAAAATANPPSLFASAPATGLTAGGAVLVRLVNAGLGMHVPSIVGAQTGPAATPVSGFSLIAEDGNVLPGVPRVQSEVFMPAGKTQDVMINVPTVPTTGTAATALPIFDRQLSLSANGVARDAGMLAYISINAAGMPVAAAFTSAAAHPDTYNSVIAGQTLVVSDPARGVLANDVNVFGANVVVGGIAQTGPVAGTNGTLTLNADGTLTYVANATAPATGQVDQFTYCGNGTISGAACTTLTLQAATKEAATGIVMGSITYPANGTFIKIQPPGILSVDKDNAGYLLTVAVSTVAGMATCASPPVAPCVTVDQNGGFSAFAPSGGGTYSFTYQAQNSQGTLSGNTNTGTVNVVFAAANGPSVTVLDGKDVLANKLGTLPAASITHITDYRWIIEEDRTFFVDPNCTTNPPPAGCPGSVGGTIVPTFGTNFHTSYMPVIAAGCTGPLSCEGGQTVFNPVTGTHDAAVCDLGNGVCRPDTTGNGFPQELPSAVHLDPTKRYYLTIFPGDAGTPFPAGNVSADCTNGVAAATDPGSCGHGMGGTPLKCTIVPPATACAFNPVTVLTQPDPYPPAKLSVFVFQDDFPLNGEHDGGGGVDVLAPNEPGLGGFNVVLFDDAGGTGDATGQMTYDMFNQPLVNSLGGTIDPGTGLDACPITKIPRIGPQLDANGNPIAGTLDRTQTGITGTIVTCPRTESDGKTLSPLAGQAVIANLMPGRYGVVATPGADRIARGEEWLQTNTLDGQKAHDSFLRIGEPSFFQEFGPAGYHVSIGFANPAIINSRLAGVCNGSDTNISGPNCTNTVTGVITTERMSRTPDERLYSSGDNSSFAFTQCYVSLGDPDGEDFAFTKCASDGSFTLSGLPDGVWRVTVFDQWNDMLVDGLSTPVPLSGGTTFDMGQIATNQWQANIYTRTFFDPAGTGVPARDLSGSQCPGPNCSNPNWGNETNTGLTLVATNIRFRDGSYSNFNNTDLAGNAGFNEVFPLFSWYVIETDTTRYANTGTHVVYDAGGPADGTPCGSAVTPPAAPCGNSIIAASLANTFETVSVPAGATASTNLRVPGAVYCSSADCTGHSIKTGPGSSDAPSACTISPTTGATNCTGSTLSTGRIDPPWVVAEGWQGFSGQNSFIEFGKRPFAEANPTRTAAPYAENGGIHGEVIYASTRPFDDPQLLLHTSWTPDVPGVTINLYQVGTAADGSQSLTMVDTTQTSSWDKWAQGFYPGTNKPYMSCPGQLPAPTTSAAGDLFFFSLFNQPMWLDVYNNGAAAQSLPGNSQFKCYDGMHNWNQVQPAYYDGAYQFPSTVGRNPLTGALTGAGATNGTPGNMTGTNCTICVPNPVTGEPMLPGSQQYVVEMVVPPGYELVKEEDKNILIGDNYIAPVTVQFPGLGGAIYIMPDQANVAAVFNGNQGSLSAYNASNAQNPTQTFGRISSLPSHEGDTGSVESFWPCVGATRIVPDFISLFPQSAEVAPFAGAKRNLCDRKLVRLDDQSAVLAKFWVFTSAHVASHFTGVITDDFTSEFDPFSPVFGEKFSPANLPVAIKDWTGQEISRVYSDHWGAYNGLTYSTWEVNPPNPTGYAPTMMVTCMNDAGTGATPDALYNPAYSQFCYEIPFMPGQTQYMDTPVVPTSAFAGAGYNNPDCDYPDATPAISEVDIDGGVGSGNIGPWASGTTGAHTLHIFALGTVPVNNNAYAGPSATSAPYNAKTVMRKYSFGSSAGTVQLFSTDGTQSVTLSTSGTGLSWGDLVINAGLPANSLTSSAWDCPRQQQTQYGGSNAKCGQLVITTANTATSGPSNAKQSVDTVNVTIGGKTPTHVIAAPIAGANPRNCTPATGPYTTIQRAIDCAAPGDLIIVDPATRATATAPAKAGVHEEMLLMWKPVRLQGVAAASSIINANTHPAGKLDVWRRQVNCLFGLSLDGFDATGSSGTHPYDPTGTYTCGTSANFGAGPATLRFFQPPSTNPAVNRATNPQVDRLPLESVIGWIASLNGNLAELLQEPSLMGALEGGAITVLSKGVLIPRNATDIFGGGAATAGVFPPGTLLLTASTGNNSGRGCNNSGTNPFPSNFYCNPSSIDGLTIENSSQGGGGVFVHGWGHYIQLANNRVMNNAGTLSGGINIGQGEFPPANTVGGILIDPGSCQSPGILPTGTQLQYCLDVNVNMHHNMVVKNSSTGDELFSATPAGAGGVSICNGSDFYKFNYNWVCGNLSTGDGGGVAHIGFSYNGDIEHNSILFNQSTNPTIPTNGGGLLVMGAPDADPECPAPDQDCLVNPPVTPSDGVGPGLMINANLIQGNAAESGSGGGLRLQGVNGSDVLAFPLNPERWYQVTVTNNIINNNVAGWDGAGISLLDALNVNIINNTVMSNDTTASSGALFDTIGAPLASAGGTNCTTSSTAACRQAAGVVAIQNSTPLSANLPATINCPAGHFTGLSAANAECRTVSFPLLYNDVIYDNRTFNITVGALGIGAQNQQNVVTLVPTVNQPAADATTANGSGVIVTGGTGACVTTGANSYPASGYWDIGVRGDTGTGATDPTQHTVINPTTGSPIILAPSYSLLTDVSSGTGYGGATQHNTSANPTVLRQYCNGARVPPELALSQPGNPLGYNVPPGIADATVPNPIFNLTPAATVDEGNNWINIAWGPLSLSNPSIVATAGTSATPLGNYGPAAGSPVINYIPGTGAGAANYAAAPPLDFYGNSRKNGFVDAGAVEFGAGSGGGCSPTVAPTTLAFGNQPVTAATTLNDAMTVTVTNSGATACTGGTFTFGGGAPQPFAQAGLLQGGGGSCVATLAAGASCTYNVVFSPRTAASFTRTLTVAYTGATVSGSPVNLTGTGIASGTGVLSFTSATGGSLSGVGAARTLTFTTRGGTSVVTVTNTGTAPLTITAETFLLNPAVGTPPRGFTLNNTGTCTVGSTLAVSGTCTLSLTAPAGFDLGVLAVVNNGTTPNATLNLLGP